MDLRRLCCAGPCACGAALVVLEVPSLRFMLASQAGLAIGWRVAAMPPNILALRHESLAELGVAEAKQHGEASFYWIPGKASPAGTFAKEGSGMQRRC